jgi:hypothetical protein
VVHRSLRLDSERAGGRRKGTPNIIGKTLSENLLGLDDESVAPTGMIDRAGFGTRRRLKERDAAPGRRRWLDLSKGRARLAVVQ